MSSRNDEIRRQLSSAMPAPRGDLADMVFSVRQIPPVDQRHQQDEQSEDDASLVTLAEGCNLCFNIFDDVPAWNQERNSQE